MINYVTVGCLKVKSLDKKKFQINNFMVMQMDAKNAQKTYDYKQLQ